MNDVKMTGNLAADCESRQLNGGWTVINFRIANSDQSKPNQSGGYENITSYFDVTHFVKNAEYWINNLKKGASVLVQGSLIVEQWENGGQKHYKTIIKAESSKDGGFPVVVIKQPGEGNYKSSWNGKRENQQTKKEESIDPFKETKKFEDDIPF